MSEEDRMDGEAREPEQDEAASGAEKPEAEAPDAGEAPPDAEAPEGGDAPDAQTQDASEGEAGGQSDAPAPAESSPDSAPAGEAAPAPDRARRGKGEEARAEEVVPGADLEPDLVLDEPGQEQDRYPDAERYAEAGEPAEPREEPEAGKPEEAPPARAEAPASRSPMELAADARYRATGKRKTSVARVILKPGDGNYTVNGRALEEFFPRPTLQKTARQPLATAGYDSRMDVVAKLHGGGVSSQAGALRHGVARALVEADPNLRGELKRRGFLTRDPRVKERKKAGLKKARKRPQFSKR